MLSRIATTLFAAWALMLAMPAHAESIDTLARDVDRLESLRAVKDLQRSYVQYGQFGLWDAVSDLFAENGRIEWGDRTIEGKAAILRWLADRHGPRGLAPGGLNTDFMEDALIHLSADGGQAEGRWSGMAFRGDGKGKAWIEGGIYENRYVREGGRWKIAALRYFPQFEGDYADGWSNVGNQDLPIVPFHYTPETVGIPIPTPVGDAPASGATLPALAARIAALNDEDGVRNLQNAYGYYVDRKMWDDAADLFADDAVVEIAGVGTFKGRAGVRRMLERMGPAGLSHGELNERPLFGTIVRIAAGGHEAHARGTELAMIGQARTGQANWEINVFRNRFVKEAGLWKIREMRIQPLMKADYATGWGRLDAARPALPAFLGPNPATGRAVDASGFALWATRSLTGRIAAPRTAPAPALADLRRRYMRSFAYDGTENVSAAYAYYLDDGMWQDMARIFAIKGNKQSPFAGYYMGRDRIGGAATAMYGPARDPRTTMRASVPYHWRFQPVILVSHDGRSATLRTRLFQPGTSKWDRSADRPNRNAFAGGMYHDQVVFEDGAWRMWSLTIDEHYFSSAGWKGGWSGVKERPAGDRPPASPLMQRYPPDIPITDLGVREEGFRGGTGTTITWPGILPMWFHYRNPVSGRVPDLYWPDCVPCEKVPEMSMTRHGYQMPPSGPAIDGVELKPGR